MLAVSLLPPMLKVLVGHIEIAWVIKTNERNYPSFDQSDSGCDGTPWPSYRGIKEKLGIWIWNIWTAHKIFVLSLRSTWSFPCFTRLDKTFFCSPQRPFSCCRPLIFRHACTTCTLLNLILLNFGRDFIVQKSMLLPFGKCEMPKIYRPTRQPNLKIKKFGKY